jgi:peptidase E
MQQIIARGAGRFHNQEGQLLLDKYVLAASGKPNPAICFLATASGDSPDYLVSYYAAFSQLTCRPSHLPLITPEHADPAALLLEQDIILVGGGNTKNMLALWREWGIDAALNAAYERGIVLAGWSAGAICWFESGVTDSIPGDLTALPCLGILPGSCCPHYDGEAERRPAYQRLIADGKMAAGYAIDNGAGLHFVDGELQRVVACEAGARAYTVGMEDGEIRETVMEVELLGE